MPPGLEVHENLLAPLSRAPRRPLSADELATLRRRLLAFYEAGAGAEVEHDGREPAEESDDAESDAAVSGARIPIPSETFLEELSQKLELHPISVYWLLRQLREQDGVVCQAELQRFVEDYFSVMVLRLLGHGWPKEVEGDEPVPSWADTNGIIPITSGTTSKRHLLSRVRERIAEDFGSDRVVAIEQEFQDIVGQPLEAWLGSTFFRCHITQFKKRPIAWQIDSAPTASSEGRRRSKSKRRTAAPHGPVFSCLVYYHRLDGDLLPKLRTHYLGPLLRGFQTELGDLERLQNRSAEQDARRLQLEDMIQELKELDRRLEAVITGGFRSEILQALAARETLDRWTSRDGGAPPRLRLRLFSSKRAGTILISTMGFG